MAVVGFGWGLIFCRRPALWATGHIPAIAGCRAVIDGHMKSAAGCQLLVQQSCKKRVVFEHKKGDP